MPPNIGRYPRIKSGWIWQTPRIVLVYNVDTASRQAGGEAGAWAGWQLCTKFPHSRPQAFIFCFKSYKSYIIFFCHTIWWLINDWWRALHPNLYSHGKNYKKIITGPHVTIYFIFSFFQEQISPQYIFLECWMIIDEWWVMNAWVISNEWWVIVDEWWVMGDSYE